MTDARKLTTDEQFEVATRRHAAAHLRRQAYIIEAKVWKTIAGSDQCSAAGSASLERACLKLAEGELEVMTLQRSIIDLLHLSARMPRQETGD